MIFYRNREYVYGETAEGKETLRDSRNTGEWLATDDDMAAQDRDQSFKKLSYDQKKKVIMENLAVMKKGKEKGDQVYQKGSGEGVCGIRVG